jgi:hypothetical protein
MSTFFARFLSAASGQARTRSDVRVSSVRAAGQITSALMAAAGAPSALRMMTRDSPLESNARCCRIESSLSGLSGPFGSGSCADAGAASVRRVRRSGRA